MFDCEWMVHHGVSLGSNDQPRLLGVLLLDQLAEEEKAHVSAPIGVIPTIYSSF